MNNLFSTAFEALIFLSMMSALVGIGNFIINFTLFFLRRINGRFGRFIGEFFFGDVYEIQPGKREN